MPQRTYDFGLFGGLDLVTPPLIVKPGKVLSSKNYEPADEGGYRRMTGYERFDGRPQPSEASYWILYFDAGTGTEPTPGDTITGLTSGGSATLHLVVTDTGTTWGVDASGYMVLFENSATAFQDNEALQVSAVTFATSDGVDQQRAAPTNALDKTYGLAAQTARRNVIAAVPGAGPVNGVWFYKGVVYAVRDNVGQTAGVMHASSGSGWSTVALGDYVDYSVGATALLQDGETINFAPSGATAVVVSQGLTSGSIAGGDAAGRIYLKTVTGTPTASDTITGATSGGTANCDSVVTAVTLPAGGSYEFENYNFGGSAATNYMWGVNAVGRGFRFDGTDFAFVHVTGLTDALDKPEHLKPFKKQLFFSFGASLQHSAVGTPMVWSAVFGAAEIATGDNITGIEDQPGGVLGVFNRNRTYLLYGDDVNNWDFVDYSLERGAIEYTTQDLGVSFYCDDRGVHNLQQSDLFGDLKMASISEHIDPLFQAQKTKIVDSIRIREKSQYRVYYSDNSGIVMRWDNNAAHKYGQRFEFMFFELANLVTTICSEEDLDGFERIFFGSDDGFVYEEKGESFDGALMEYNMRLVFCHCGTPRQKKRYHKVTFQVDAPDVVPIQFYAEFSYGDVDQPAQVGSGEIPPEVQTGGGIWDTDNWSEFFWDAQFVGEMEAYIDGQGINASILLRGESNYEKAHTLKSCTYNFTPRALKR